MSRFFQPLVKKAIFFDLNGTLFDTDAAFRAAFHQVLEPYTSRWDGNIKEASERTFTIYKEEWNRRTGSRRSPSHTLMQIRRECLKKALYNYPIKLGISQETILLQKIKAAQREQPLLYDHVHVVLEQLSQNYKLGIISNGSREWLEKALKQTGITQWIPLKSLYCTDNKNRRKPNKAIFQQALRGLTTDATASVMVGDTWSSDIAGAFRAGLDAVWIDPSHDKKSSLHKHGNRKLVMIQHVKQLPGVF